MTQGGSLTVAAPGSSPKPLEAPFLNLLADRWKEFEALLLAPAKVPEFKKFLQSYRGLGRRSVPVKERAVVARLQDEVGGGIVAFLSELLDASGLIVQLARESSERAHSTWTAIERAINLSLYAWYGAGDRNYQFRTIVHFCELSGLGGECGSLNGESIFASFDEDGMRIGKENSAHFPRVSPISAVCLPLPEPPQFRRLFARIRTIQRELCQLTDEWEHRNSLLAVRFAEVRKAAAEKTEEGDPAEVLADIAARRDHLASWCLAGLRDFQMTISNLRSQTATLPSDLQSEVDAAEAVLLSALQKIFLPASVSRHTYTPVIAEILHQWSDARLYGHPHDLSTRLLHDAFSWARGKPETHGVSPSVDELLRKRSYEWTFAFDPGPGLKTFSWVYETKCHLLLSTACLIAVAAKRNPNPLDSHWLSNIASLFQMPQTFLVPAQRPPMAHVDPRYDAHQLVGQALAVLDRVPQRMMESETFTYVRGRIMSLENLQEEHP